MAREMWFLVLKYRQPNDDVQHMYSEKDYLTIVGLVSATLNTSVTDDALDAASLKFGIPVPYLKVIPKGPVSDQDWMVALRLEEQRVAQQLLLEQAGGQ